MRFADNKEIWISEDGLLSIFKRYNDICLCGFIQNVNLLL